MPLPSNCPNCQTIRPPNALFCPACGLSYEAPSTTGGRAPATSREVELGVWSGVKFGAGFVIGGTIVAVAFWAVLFLLVLVGLSLPAVPR